MKCGSVPSSWTGITNCMSAAPLLALLEEVDRRGVDHKDLQAVRAVWDEMSAKAVATAAELNKRIAARNEAAKLDNQTREDLGHTFPALRNKLKVKL